MATVVIDNPPVNAFHPYVAAELAEFFDAVAKDRGVRALVLTGAGSHFVGGGDLRFVETLDKRAAEDYVLEIQAVQDRVRRMPQPVIAAVNGTALGGGCELAMVCDIRIAEEQAVFGQPEVTLGIIPGAGGTQHLPRLIPVGLAKRMIFTGERISATQANLIGLVDEVVPSGTSRSVAEALGARIGRNAPLAVTAAKRSIDLGLQTGVLEGHRIEAALFAPLVETSDFAEGIDAFFSKRTSKFRGE